MNHHIIIIWGFIMFILNKKRIYIILTCIIISVAVFQTTSLNNSKIQETVALPVNKKVIILDAGHGRR